jgi:uncharacterized protein YkwD
MLKWLLAVSAALVLAAPGSAWAAGLTHSESSLLREMNVVRAEHGLRPLTFDTHLQRAARAHSHEMIATGVFAHGAFANRMARFHVGGSLAGENLAWGTGYRTSAAAVVGAWLASPEHRANLLRPAFRRVGVGTVGGTFLGYQGAQVVTADFAS